MRQTGTRDHLLSTGLKLLHARGFHASGVQDIAAAAQVPKGSFYTHFDSKEQFGAEVLGRYWETRASKAAEILSDESLPPLGRLKAYFRPKTRDRTAASLETGCLIGNFSAELAGDSKLVRERLGAVFAAWTRLLSNCIREAQQAGDVRAELDPDTIAAFLIDAFEGAVLRAKAERDPAPLLRFETIVFSLILT